MAFRLNALIWSRNPSMPLAIGNLNHAIFHIQRLFASKSAVGGNTNGIHTSQAITVFSRPPVVTNPRPVTFNIAPVPVVNIPTTFTGLTPLVGLLGGPPRFRVSMDVGIPNNGTSSPRNNSQESRCVRVINQLNAGPLPRNFFPPSCNDSVADCMFLFSFLVGRPDPISDLLYLTSKEVHVRATNGIMYGYETDHTGASLSVKLNALRSFAN